MNLRVLIASFALFMLVSLLVADPVVTTNNGLAIWYDVRSDGQAILAPAFPWKFGTQLSLPGKKQGQIPFCFRVEVLAGNEGGPGDGQRLYVSPSLPPHPTTGTGLHVTGSFNKKGQFTNVVNHNQRSLYRYLTVEPRSAGDEVITTLGIDSQITWVDQEQSLASVSASVDPAWWDQVSSTVTPIGGDWHIETQAEKDPFASGPVFDSTGGAIPGNVYRVAEFLFTGSPLMAGVDPGSYVVTDSVNAQTITRGYASGGPVPELPDFGYATIDVGTVNTWCDAFVSGGQGGNPEPATGDGSTVGSTSAIPVAEIIVTAKGDFSGDGFVNGVDIAGFNIALFTDSTELPVRDLYLGDFNNDGFVNGSDIAWFNLYLSEL